LSLCVRSHPAFIGLDGYTVRESTGRTTQYFSADRITTLPRLDPIQGKLWWGGSWIEWRPQLIKFICYGPPTYNYSAILYSDELSSEERGELIRFLLTLSLWEQTPGKKSCTAQWVWDSSITRGHAFADELDDFFAYGWRLHPEFPESYNFSFPARFLPRFNTPKDDLPLSKEVTSAVPEVLLEFEQVLVELLDSIEWENVRLPSDEEILFERSTNSSFNKRTEERGPQWKNSIENPSFEEKELVGDRCKVQVYPSGVRDTVIADIKANHSIRWLERALRHILEFVPESADTLSSTTYRRRLECYIQKDGWHALRDIKKCGLTYNSKELFPVVFREIARRKPDPRWKRSRIYEKLIYRDFDGSYHECNKGYFLGMANHTVTLCGVVISRMARHQAYSRHPSSRVKNTTIVGNDDLGSVFYPACRDSKKLASEYLSCEHETHAALGNITNQKKSVVKRHGLFYENYSAPGWKNKEALVTNALACAYLAPDIRTAKEYVSSQSDRFKNRWAFSALRDLANYWGPEFYDIETELRVDKSIGGWLSQTRYSLCTSLLDVEELDDRFHSILPAAIALCGRYNNSPKPEFKNPGLVRNHMYTGPAKASDPRVQLLTLTVEDIFSYYLRLTSYERNYKSRIENYKSVKPKPFKSILDCQKILLRKGAPWHAIPDTMVAYESWTSTGNVYMDVSGERDRHDDDPFTALLQDDLHPYDSNMVWDPGIPTKALYDRLVTSIWMFESASQFSNTGALPIVEYFNRKRIYPVAHRYRELRMRYGPIEKDRKIFSEKGTNRHRESCLPSKEDVSESESESEKSELPKDSISDLIRVAESELKEEVPEFRKERDKIPVPGQIDLSGLSVEEAADKLLANIDNKDWHNVVSNPDDRNDIFDGSDEEGLGLDLDAW
jgi:hypothetical protein